MQMSQIDKDVNADQDSNSETLEIRSTGLNVSNHGERTVMKAKRKLDTSHNTDDEAIPPAKRMNVKKKNMTGFQDRGRLFETERRLKSRKHHTFGRLIDEDFSERSSARKSLCANFKELKEEIEPFQVAKYLKEKGIVDDEFYRRFRELRTRHEKSEALVIKVDLLLSKRNGLHAFTTFKEALDENHDNIVNKLLEQPTSPEVRCTPFKHDLELWRFFKKAKDKIIATLEPLQFIDDLVTVHAIDLQLYELITKKESREERATELYKIAVQNYRIIKQLFEYNKELSLEFEKECSTHTLSSNPEATRVAVRYSLSETIPVQDTCEHSDVMSEIKKLEKDIADRANDNSDLGEDISNRTANVLEYVTYGSIIFRLRTSGDVSIERLKECCENGTAVDWLMSILQPDDIKKLQELNANGGVIECYFDDSYCKKQIFDEVFQECCCVLNRNFIQSHLEEFEGFLRGSELDVIKAMSDTLDETLAFELSQIKVNATEKDLIQKLIEFLLQSELQQICFCVIEKELRKKKEYNLFQQQQQQQPPPKISLGEEIDDEVTIIKENIKRSVDLLEEELDARWFVKRLESRGDEACMKILTAIKTSQSRKCCTKQFLRFLCEEEDIDWFIETLYEYSPHAHAILTQSKNPAIECDTRRAMLSVYDFILDELEPLELRSCLSNNILEQLNFLQLEKNAKRFDRATFFMQQIFKNENLEIIQDVMVAMASKYFNIERVIKDVLTKGSLSEHYLCPRVEKHKLGMLKSIHKAPFKLPISNAAEIEMAHEIHFKNNKYRQWVKAGLGLGYLKEGLAPFCNDIGRQQHNDIINQIQQTKTPHPNVPCGVCQITTLKPDHVRVSKGICPLKQDKCNCCFPKNKNRCPNNICGAIYDSIIQNHASKPPAPFWKNSDAHDWFADPWSISKCFINAPGYKDKTSAFDTDCTGLLLVIINNIYFHSHIGCNVTGPNNLFSKVRQYRNNIFHSSTMRLEESTANSYIDNMIAILQDGKELVHRQDAQLAVRKLKDLKKKDYIITTEGVEEILRQIKEEMEIVVKSTENAASEYDDQKKMLIEFETKISEQKSENEKELSEIEKTITELKSQMCKVMKEKLEMGIELNKLEKNLETFVSEPKEEIEKLQTETSSGQSQAADYEQANLGVVKRCPSWKSFYYSKRISAHMIQNMNTRHYICQVCRTSFADRNLLLQHESIQHNENLFKSNQSYQCDYQTPPTDHMELRKEGHDNNLKNKSNEQRGMRL